MNHLDKIKSAIDAKDGKNVSVLVTDQFRERVSSPFIILFHSELMKLVNAGQITSFVQLKVCLKLCEVVQYGNMISINQTKIAEQLGMAKSNFSRTLKQLTAAGLLIETEDGLVFNPALIVKGKLSELPPELWDKSLGQGFMSPVRSVRKRQEKQIQIDFDKSLSDAERKIKSRGQDEDF